MRPHGKSVPRFGRLRSLWRAAEISAQRFTHFFAGLQAVPALCSAGGRRARGRGHGLRRRRRLSLFGLCSPHGRDEAVRVHVEGDEAGWLHADRVQGIARKADRPVDNTSAVAPQSRPQAWRDGDVDRGKRRLLPRQGVWPFRALRPERQGLPARRTGLRRRRHVRWPHRSARRFAGGRPFVGAPAHHAPEDPRLGTRFARGCLQRVLVVALAWHQLRVRIRFSRRNNSW
mmetsp:Transcript_90267/g.254733  ORF Transcript_90267/g.254733 Transcript_90267/m.254733 type:complete len:230 (+) Transcript_90267:2486-3175(+)